MSRVYDRSPWRILSYKSLSRKFDHYDFIIIYHTMECSPEEFNAHMDEEHLEIVDHITQLEEIARQHFEHEAKFLELLSHVSAGPNDLVLETHKKTHQKLLEAIEGIANEFRDHIRLEEWYQVQNKNKA